MAKPVKKTKSTTPKTQRPALDDVSMKKEKSKKKDGVKALEIKKYVLKQFIKWLKTITKIDPTGNPIEFPFALHGQKTRHRNQIVNILSEKYELVESERVALCEEQCKKGKDGKPKMTEQGSYDIADRDKFDKAFGELMDETIVIDILPSTEAAWETVKDIVLNGLRTEMSYPEGIMYEEVCKALEQI